MIQQGLHAMERLNHLLETGQGEQKPCVVHLIEPMYRGAERVMRDYTGLYLSFIEQIYTYQDAPTVISWLTAQRMAYLPLWGQVHALDIDAEGAHAQPMLRSLQQRIVRFMQSCVSLIEENGAALNGYGYDGPSILSQLYRKSQLPLPMHRPILVDMAKKHYKAVEQAWEDVVEIYSTLKYECRENVSTAPCLTVSTGVAASSFSSFSSLADDHDRC